MRAKKRIKKFFLFIFIIIGIIIGGNIVRKYGITIQLPKEIPSIQYIPTQGSTDIGYNINQASLPLVPSKTIGNIEKMDDISFIKPVSLNVKIALIGLLLIGFFIIS